MEQKGESKSFIVQGKQEEETVSLGALSAEAAPRRIGKHTCHSACDFQLPPPTDTTDSLDDLTSPLAVSPFRAGHGITVFTTLINSWPDSVDTTSDRAR